MKIGVISDTHIAAISLNPKKLASRLINKVTEPAEELYQRLKPHFAGVDLVIHAGDVVSLPVIAALEEFGPVEVVSGNMDPFEITSRYPASAVVAAAGFKIGVMHGYGPPDGLERKIRAQFEKLDLIIFGHSHQPFLGEVDDVVMFNPGSPTDRRWAPHHSIGILELDKKIKARHIRLD